MDGALGWISAVAEWFGQFVPRWVVVPTTHGAVKFVRGSRVVLLGPGLHFYWPLVTIFVLHPVAEQTTDLAAQTITTGDGRPALVRAVIAYEIENLETLIARNFDPDDTITLGRYGSTEEMANTVGFLCSSQASFINGQYIAVDGGFDASGVGLPTLRRNTPELKDVGAAQ